MIKRKVKRQISILSALFGLAIMAVSFSNSLKAQENTNYNTVVKSQAAKVQKAAPAVEEGMVLPRGSLIAREESIQKRLKQQQISEEQALQEEELAKVEGLRDASPLMAPQDKEKPQKAMPAEQAPAMSWNDSNDTIVESFDDYVLGPEDKLKITVFGERELTGDYRVGSDGSIAFPLVGNIRVEGLTLRQTEEAIKQKLKQGFLKKPSVSIEIAESRPFYILGEVRRPGSYNYISGMSVLQAVAISGGFTYRANRKKVEILRGSQAPATPIDATTLEKVKPGDIIFVQERFF